jgi:hypothetical protein
MKTLNQQQAEDVAKALACYTPSTPLDDTQCDALARYIAVTREMKGEPFFSEDNRDTLVGVEGRKDRFARFGHPAFVKSAILPFRKLWLPSEPCHFEKVRDNLMQAYGQMPVGKFSRLESYLSHYYESHERSLEDLVPFALRISNVSKVKDIIELWVHTVGVHTGRDESLKKSQGKFKLEDFDAVDRKAGRNEFEWCFRINMLLIAYNSYLHFAEIIAEPIFEHLLQTGYRPSFEVESALKFNPYANDGSDRLLIDPFWHLDKESEEETFDRLLKRQSFNHFDTFFNGYYFKGMGYSKRKTLNNLKEHESFEKLLDETGATLLTEPDDSLKLGSSFGVREINSFQYYSVIVYENRVVYMEGKALQVLESTFKRFRHAFIEHREHVERSEEMRGRDWCWDE